MMDDSLLRRKVRSALQAGELPNRLPDKLLGGTSTGGRCAVCGDATDGGIEMELVFTDDALDRKSYYAHPRCLSIFEREILTFAAGRQYCGNSPPADTPEPPRV